MGHDSELLTRVRAALTPIPNVEEKRMFGSTAFMVHGKLCVSARAERIMCRIDLGERYSCISNANLLPMHQKIRVVFGT